VPSPLRKQQEIQVVLVNQQHSHSPWGALARVVSTHSRKSVVRSITPPANGYGDATIKCRHAQELEFARFRFDYVLEKVNSERE